MKIYLFGFLLTVLGCMATCGQRPSPKNPLIFSSGQKVTSLKMWSERRLELENLIQNYVYGFAPEAPKDPQFRLLFSVTDSPRVAYIYREVEVLLPPFDKGLSLRLAIFSPKNIDRPPVVLSLNKCGNHTVSEDPYITLENPEFMHRKCDMRRGGHSDQWSINEIVAEGFALVTFFPGHLVPDSKDAIAPLINAHLQLNAETRWGAIRAWAWLLSRAMDYIVTDEMLDGRKVVVTGHSRRGKAALLAAALDTRIALVAPHQSGTFGMPLFSNGVVESVKRITKSYPHWFNNKILEYRDRAAELPIDQNFVTALIAPRPIISTAGCSDLWASNDSAYENLNSIESVYNFLGAYGFGIIKKVKNNEAMTNFNGVGRTFHFVKCPSGHTLDPVFWKTILRFAKHQWGM